MQLRIPLTIAGLLLWSSVALIVDMSTHSGVADGFLYAPGVIATLALHSVRFTIAYSVWCTALIVLGIFVSPAAAVPQLIWIANRLYSIIVIWLIAHFVRRSVRDSRQIKQLETMNMITMSAWTKEVNVDGAWISIEEFLKRRFGIEVSHGIDPASSKRILDEIERMKQNGGGINGGPTAI
ncbi:MAG TPA: hypothetical protein PLE73_05285 [Spirochaetota bacterium]|nr:hypothetical protein [Spirochaetota bacterium]